MRRTVLAAAAVLLLAAGASALEVPFLSGRVNDEARLLDAGASSALERTLKDYETRTGRQIAVLTIPSLAGEPLEEFSLKVARTWKLGTKGRDDGVLLLVARDDRKIRIEVGYGLEGALPDALAGRIIRDVMVPRFRGGAFAAGVQEGAEAVIAALDGHAPATSPFRALDALTWADFVILVIAVLYCGIEWDEIRTTGTDVSVFLWGLAALPLLFSPLAKLWGLPSVLVPLFLHLFGFTVGKFIMMNTDWGRRRLKKRTGPHRHDSIFFGGGGGGGGGRGLGGGGGWSSSGGGFSGGGGSFGGGGASGGW